MKNIIKIMAGLVCLLSVSAMAAVTPQPWAAYAIGPTASGATNSYAIISAHSANNGAPIVTYLNATGDAAGSKITFYSCSPPMLVTGVNTNAIIPCTTNGGALLAQKDWLILRHMATDTYERVSVLTTTGTTYITCFGGEPATACALGDQLYKCTAAGSITVGSATKELNGAGIYAGQPGRPLMAVINGDAAATIGLNAICATYAK